MISSIFVMCSTSPHRIGQMKSLVEAIALRVAAIDFNYVLDLYIKV